MCYLTCLPACHTCHTTTSPPPATTHSLPLSLPACHLPYTTYIHASLLPCLPFYLVYILYITYHTTTTTTHHHLPPSHLYTHTPSLYTHALYFLLPFPLVHAYLYPFFFLCVSSFSPACHGLFILRCIPCIWQPASCLSTTCIHARSCIVLSPACHCLLLLPCTAAVLMNSIWLFTHCHCTMFLPAITLFVLPTFHLHAHTPPSLHVQPFPPGRTERFHFPQQPLPHCTTAFSPV